MENINEYINSRIDGLNRIIPKIKKLAGKDPDVHLRTRTIRGKMRFYICDKKGKETYIGSGDLEKIKPVVQREYNSKVLIAAKDELAFLKKFISSYPVRAEDIYDQLNPARRSLVEPLVLDDEMYAQRWLETPYVQRVIEKGVTTYPTIKGDRVVSKSEKIIADEMFRLGIPYKYDCRLELIEDGEVVGKFPDFTALNKKRRKIYYVEHLGMMDKNDYLERNLKKIELYEQNGIYPGEKLILFHETSDRPLDMDTMEKMLVRFLIE